MSTVEGALGGPAIEVVAKTTGRRFTLDYKRKIAQAKSGRKAGTRAGRGRDKHTWRGGPGGRIRTTGSGQLPIIDDLMALRVDA
jgi:hypothetical protein